LWRRLWLWRCDSEAGLLCTDMVRSAPLVYAAAANQLSAVSFQLMTRPWYPAAAVNNFFPGGNRRHSRRLGVPSRRIAVGRPSRVAVRDRRLCRGC
jgi:hypothetical protein